MAALRRRRVLGASVAAASAWAWAGGPARAQQPAAADWARELRRKLAASSATRADENPAVARQRLLDQAEAHLQAGQSMAALATFEQAALLQHAADIEMGIVRAQMAAGEFRRALAFAAHTAGAHRDQPGGTALYAWLLHACGQHAPARRLLDGAIAQAPQPDLLRHTLACLTTAEPLSDELMRQRPWRMAPYGHGVPDDAAAGALPACRVAASALLLPAGDMALAPAAALAQGGRIWLRDATGRTVEARPQAGEAHAPLLRLALATALPAPRWDLAPRDPFAGSPGSMVEFAADAAGAPAWPLLREGFFVGLPGAAERPLGIAAAPGPRGGPVFDRAGRLCGIAWRDGAGRDRLLPPSRWPMPAQATAPAADAAPASPVLQDLVYERAMRLALQVLVPTA
jgi:hypothetical protein